MSGYPYFWKHPYIGMTLQYGKQGKVADPLDIWWFFLKPSWWLQHTSTRSKDTGQIGSSPQIGVNLKKIKTTT